MSVKKWRFVVSSETGKNKNENEALARANLSTSN
jgi:hypothetical protein